MLGMESALVRCLRHSGTSLFLTCLLLAGVGCSSIARSKTPPDLVAQSELERAPIPANGSTRGASPDPKPAEAAVIQLGKPTPIEAADTEPAREESSLNLVPNARRKPEVVFSWRSDRSQFASEFLGDLESLCTRDNALVLLAAGGASFAMHESLDDDIARNTAKHPNQWGKVQDFFGGVGNPLHHMAAASGLYAYSLLEDDMEIHELSKSLFNAAAISTLSTTLLKVAANTTRPNGDPDGWPSGHTCSSTAIAAVLDEYYGHCVGVPAFLLAGFVAWERIDDREHDLSDVVFGAALGYVIGRAVATEHQSRFCGMQIEPFIDPVSGASGIGLERRY